MAFVRSKISDPQQSFVSLPRISTKGWMRTKGLDDDKAWSTIKKGRHLQTFMAQPDHVQAIKEYFLSLLADVKRFQSEHRELPWSASSPADEEEQ